MELETQIVLFNLTVGFLTLIPTFFVMWLFKEHPPKYYGYLLWGGFLIACAAFNFSWLTDVITQIEQSSTKSDQDTLVKHEVLENLRVWVYVFPAVSAAIGANLFTAFLTTKKPSNV